MDDPISNIYNDLSEIVDDLIKENIVKETFNKNNISIDFSSQSKKGDISTNLFIILKKFFITKETDVKNILINKIKKINYIKVVNIADAGFINIFFEDDYLIDNLKKILTLRNDFDNSNFGNGESINIEFVSANPTGPIHIAHLRGAVYGDVLANILSKTGHKVTKEYYVNDTGSQITILGNSLYKRYLEIVGQKISFKKNEYPGEYLIEIAKQIFLKDKNKWVTENDNIKNKFFKDHALKRNY